MNKQKTFDVDNSGINTNCRYQTIYVHKLVINGNSVEYTPSLSQRIKAMLGLGPTKEQMEDWARKEILGLTTPATEVRDE